MRRARAIDRVCSISSSICPLNRLHSGVREALPGLVRAMNCYYSNLIEGHNTHPVDIERALKQDYSDDPTKRDLQLEASAHIAVQQWIDGGGLRGRALSLQAMSEIHFRFCNALPEHLLWAVNPQTQQKEKVVPGQTRQRDVKVGRHVPVSPGAIPRFMQRYETVYGALGKVELILSVAAAHHRLLWIHPFLDGNGRVARLVSYATFLETLETGGVWSIARGLARNAQQYKAHLANCDLQRRNDLDGRGNLSEEALVEFTEFFLSTCIDQVEFMEKLLKPSELWTRVLTWAQEQVRLGRLAVKSEKVLEALLLRGELARADVPAIVDTGDRQARRVVASLMEHGVLKSASSRAPLRLNFPAALAGAWMPGLFPEQ